MQAKKIKWKTSLLSFSIYLCFSIFLTSCTSCNHKNSTDRGIPEFQPGSDITPGDISDSLVARIYFDATLSMQGFVVPSSTDYTRMCPYLESVIVSGWTNAEVNFFRFGESVEPLDRDTYLQVGHKDFYEDKNIGRKTFIQKVIEYEDQLGSNNIEASPIPEKSTEEEGPNTPEGSTEIVQPTQEISERAKGGQLVVIVTDLFQDRGNITVLVRELKEKYIQKGREVGLFGLRSQFDGTVYDTGIGQAPMPHRSDPNNPETFRPFYLLVLGRQADIAHYFGLIANGFPEAKTVIFSRYLVENLLSFEGAEIKTDNLNSRTINRKHSQEPRLKQYEIVRNTESANISVAELKYDPLPHAMFFDSHTLEVSVVATHKQNGETQRSPDAEAYLEVTPMLSNNEEGNQLTVDFNLASRELRSAVYLYEVTLSPKVDTYRAPDWCSEWDMGTERDPTKTLNLVNFVRDLSQVTAREHRPKIAQFYCYIKKR